jgi:hypothetical protein
MLGEPEYSVQSIEVGGGDTGWFVDVPYKFAYCKRVRPAGR